MFNHLVHYSLIFKDWPHALKLDICESELHSTFNPQSKLECKWGSFIAKTVLNTCCFGAMRQMSFCKSSSKTQLL